MATVLKSRWSFRRSLFATLTAFSVVLICFIAFQYYRERQYRIHLIDNQLQLYNRQAAEALTSGERIEDFVAEQREVFGNVRLTLIDTSGCVLYDSRQEASTMPNHATRNEVARAISKGEGYTIRRQSTANSESYFYSATLIDSIVIRSALPYQQATEDVLQTDLHFITLMLFIVIVIGAIAFFYMRRLERNIKHLRRFVEQADRGEHISNFEPFDADELGEISDHIVRTYSALQQAQDDLRNEHEKVLHEQEEKIRIKRQLTNNINHELKTPVSSIKGYLETIINNPDLPEATVRNFVSKSYAQSERLLQLLQEVSTLTRLDDGTHKIERSEVDLSAIVREIIVDMNLQPPANRMFIDCDFIDRQLTMIGNQQLLSSIFRNLTDNSVAYSFGSHIFISLIEESCEQLTIRFSDNGMGVEPEHLSRLFERFYRVDKGRSRKSGGTGLGLAIVKNAVTFHGGTIAVALHNGNGGLEFTFTLRRK